MPRLYFPVGPTRARASDRGKGKGKGRGFVLTANRAGEGVGVAEGRGGEEVVSKRPWAPECLMTVYCTLLHSAEGDCHARAARHGDSETEPNGRALPGPDCLLFSDLAGPTCCAWLARRQVDELWYAMPCMHTILYQTLSGRIRMNLQFERWYAPELGSREPSALGWRPMPAMFISLSVPPSAVYPLCLPACSESFCRFSWPNPAPMLPKLRGQASVGLVASEKDEGPGEHQKR